MDLRTLNILTGHLARTRGYDDAAAVVDAVRRQPALCLAPRAVTHNILLDALLKAGRVDEALEYFYAVAAEAAREEQGQGQEGQGQQQRQSSKRPPPPLLDSTTYDILLSGLVQNGRVSTAGVVHQMMGKAGLPPTVYTYAALVRMQKSASDVYRLWAQARCVCMSVRVDINTPHRRCLTQRHADHHHHNPNSATCGPRLSLPFLNLLVYELGHTHGDLEGALAAFRALLQTPGLGRPNTISYNSLLSALVRDADADATVPCALEAPSLSGDAEVVGMMEELRRGPRNGGGDDAEGQDALALLGALGGKPVLEAALAGVYITCLCACVCVYARQAMPAGVRRTIAR